MRCSARPTDPNYIGSHNLGRFEARLDGVLVSRVVLADTDLGEVHRHKTDVNGNIILNAMRDGAEVEVLKGNVQIIDRKTGEELKPEMLLP